MNFSVGAGGGFLAFLLAAGMVKIMIGRDADT